MSKRTAWIALAALLALIVAPVAVAKDCRWSRFESDLDLPEWEQASGPLVLAVDGRKVSLEGFCPAKKSRVRSRRGGLSVKARWKRCSDVVKGVRIRFRTTPDCEAGNGMLRIKNPRMNVRFKATRVSGCSSLIRCAVGTLPVDTTRDGCADQCAPDVLRCERASDCGLEGSYCAKPFGDCGGVGTCSRPMGVICTADWDPVCGCDGRTYSNPCVAHAGGASIAHVGDCLQSCGGIQGLGCEKGQLCDLAPGECGTMDLGGVCVERRPFCQEIFRPVCGCDGQTYGNDCERIAASVPKDFDGACGAAR